MQCCVDGARQASSPGLLVDCAQRPSQTSWGWKEGRRPGRRPGRSCNGHPPTRGTRSPALPRYLSRPRSARTCAGSSQGVLVGARSQARPTAHIRACGAGRKRCNVLAEHLLHVEQNTGSVGQGTTRPWGAHRVQREHPGAVLMVIKGLLLSKEKER